jgi:hypothetical protein
MRRCGCCVKKAPIFQTYRCEILLIICCTAAYDEIVYCPWFWRHFICCFAYLLSCIISLLVSNSISMESLLSLDANKVDEAVFRLFVATLDGVPFDDEEKNFLARLQDRIVGSVLVVGVFRVPVPVYLWMFTYWSMREHRRFRATRALILIRRKGEDPPGRRRRSDQVRCLAEEASSRDTAAVSF